MAASILNPSRNNKLLDRYSRICSKGLVVFAGRNIERAIDPASAFSSEPTEKQFRKAITICMKYGNGEEVSRSYIDDLDAAITSTIESRWSKEWKLGVNEHGDVYANEAAGYFRARVAKAATSSTILAIDNDRSGLLSCVQDSVGSLAKVVDLSFIPRNGFVEQLSVDIASLEKFASHSAIQSPEWRLLGPVWSPEILAEIASENAVGQTARIADCLDDYSFWLTCGFAGLLFSTAFGFNQMIWMSTSLGVGMGLSLLTCRSK